MGCSNSNDANTNNQKSQPQTNQNVNGKQKENITVQMPDVKQKENITVQMPDIKSGVLSDNCYDYFANKPGILISTEAEYNKFKEVIARQLVEYTNEEDGRMPDPIYVDNKTDYFLNLTSNFDLKTKNIVVVSGATIETVTYADVSYKIKFSDKQGKDNMYCAAIVSKFNRENNEFLGLIFENEKPSMIIEQRAQNMNIQRMNS